jgi:predicted RNA polymerase sigma factor
LGDDADARAAHLAPDPLGLLLADEADEVGDDALRLMFIACHPDLTDFFGPKISRISGSGC